MDKQYIIQLLESGRLSPKAKGNLISALQTIQQRKQNNRTTTVSADQLAQFSGNPELASLQGSYGISPTALASMLARRNSVQAKEDAAPSLENFAGTPLVLNSDQALAKSQLARGGTTAEAILRENSGVKSFDWQSRMDPNLMRDTSTGPGFDYTGISPIKSGDQLLNNNTFRSLLQSDPEKATTLYKAFTGKDFSADYKEKDKQQQAVQKDYREGIRREFISGNMRRNPTMGWLERRRVITDPMGIKPPTETWEPADSVLQQADKQYDPTSYGRPAMAGILDEIPGPAKNTFIQSYYQNKAAGLGDREAITAANKAANDMVMTPEKLAMMQNQAQPQASPTPTTPPAAYPEQAAANQLRQAGQTATDWLWNEGVRGAMNTIPAAANVGTAILNAPNHVANFIGGLFGANQQPVKPIPYTPMISNTNNFMDDLGWSLFPETMQEQRKQSLLTPEQTKAHDGIVGEYNRILSE
jgi:hypothetical protein